jgi:hypothetical protein
MSSESRSYLENKSLGIDVFGPRHQYTIPTEGHRVITR